MADVESFEEMVGTREAAAVATESGGTVATESGGAVTTGDETVVTCSTTDGNGSYHGLAPSFFQRDDTLPTSKHCRRRPDNPNGLSKFRKYRVYLSHLRQFKSVRSRLLFRG